MRRTVWFTAALALACGEAAKPQAGSVDRVYFPTGLAVRDHRLLVVSSNADLRYDDATGGSLIALDPTNLDTVRVDGAVNIRSFGGDLAIADPAFCTSLADPLAIVATRGSNTLNAVPIGGLGAFTCDRCGIPLSGQFADPLAVAVACSGGRDRDRAFVGYLRTVSGEAWISEYDLVSGELRNALVGSGPIRGFAYDADLDRLYMVGLATSQPTPLRWLDLAGCEIGLAPGAGGCTLGQATIPSLPAGLELRSMALAHPFTRADGTLAPQRAFLTGRLYDTAAAVTPGGRTVDYGGLLVVVDLVENAFGGVDLQLVNALSIGHGAQDVRVLPLRAGRRDVVAALAVDDGDVWIYDDETRSLAVFGRCATVSSSCPVATGAPELGHSPYGLAVDPELVGTMARLYVGSFAESFITPIDVPLDAPEAAVFSGGTQRKITGGTP